MIKNFIIRFINLIKDELLMKSMFNLYGVKIEKNVSIDKNCMNKIGKYTFIGQNTIIGPSTKSVGSYCSIAPDVIIGPNSHDIMAITTSTFIHAYASSLDYEMQNVSRNYIKYKQLINERKTIIGNDVWIGYRAIILPGVIVGDGAIIGAGSIVTKDVLPYSIVAGNPAKHIRYRFELNIIEKLINVNIYSNDKDKLFDLFVKSKDKNIKDFISNI